MSSGLGRWAVVFLLVALLVAACAAHSVISTGPDGFRTFAVVRSNPDGSPVACAAFARTNPVAGILEVQAGAREPVWLRADDGRRLSVVWPAGFTVRFDPTPRSTPTGARSLGGPGTGSCSARRVWEMPPERSTTPTSPRVLCSAAAIQS